jgi:hypothetical protein
LLTFSGGIPQLNDYLTSLFISNLFNVKFADLLNYLDIFEKFNEKVKPANGVIKEYFHIDNSYLSFHDSNCVTADLGSSEENLYLLQTNTGKTKITTQEYIKFLKILSPTLAVIPFEYVYLIHT